MRSSLLMLEDVMVLTRTSHNLVSNNHVKKVMKYHHDRSLALYEILEDEDDFQVSDVYQLFTYYSLLYQRKCQSLPQ